MKKYLLLFLLILFTSFLFKSAFSQQSFTIKGHVFNAETNEPVFNANIVVAESKTGTSSDAEGNFELRLVNETFKIRVSSLGFATREMSVESRSVLNGILEIGLVPTKQKIGDIDVFGNFSIPGRDTSINRIPLSISPAITFISIADIEKQGAVTLTDALKYVPGGWTETRGRKSKQFFSVRGQKYPYPDYSIDGVWQKEFEETAYFLSALDIESVEIVRSSSALVKGLSGLTGVIEVKTKKPEKETFSFLSKYGENNNYVANVQYGNKVKNLSFNSAVSFSGTNGIPNRRGKERIANFHGNVNWAINKRLDLSAGATYISGTREFVSIVEPGSSNISNREEEFDPLKTLITYTKLDYKWKNGSQTEWQANYTYRNANYINYNLSKNSTSTHWDKDWEYGFSFLHSQVLGENNTLRAGGLYNHWEAPDGKRYYAGRRCDLQTWSGVIADEQKFGRFLLDAGFRLIGGHINEWGGFGIEGSAAGFQNVEAIKDQAAQLEWQSATGVSYVLSGVSSLHYNFSGGTIAPRKGSLDGNGETPLNETRLQHDLGFSYKPGTQNEITVSAFFTNRKNALNLSGETIIAENDLIMELYENVNKKSFGLEMASKLNIPKLHSSLFLNTTLMKSVKETGDKMVDDVQLPNVIVNAGFLFEKGKFDANLFMNYMGPYSNNRFVSSGWITENGNFPLGDFVSADLTTGFTFSGKYSKRIFAEIKNILDEKYQTVAGYPDAGRIFQLGIKFNY